MSSYYNMVTMFVVLVIAGSTCALGQDKHRPNVPVSLGDLQGIMTGNIIVHWPSQKDLETHSTVTTSLSGCAVDGYTWRYEFADKPASEPSTVKGASLKPQFKATFNANTDGRAIISDIVLVCGGERKAITDSIILRHPEGSKELLKHFTK